MKPDQYHHGKLKESLITLARKHLEEGLAYEELSLRKMARELGVSAAAPYRHFQDNDAFLAEVAQRGFESLINHLQQSLRPQLSGPTSPAENLASLGAAYLGFALASPQLYRLMFSYTLSGLNQFAALADLAQSSFSILQGLFPPDSATAVLDAMAAWAYIHGLADLMIQKRVPESFTYDQSIRDYLTGLFARSLEKAKKFK
jgi:AcrR family transcriptional regulator